MRLKQILNSSVLVALFSVIALNPSAASAQSCIGGSTCTPLVIHKTPVAATPLQSSSSLSQASTGEGKYTVVAYNDVNTPTPANLPPGNYPGWCGTSQGHPAGGQTYVATTVPPQNDSPAYKIYMPGYDSLGNVIAVESPLNYAVTWNQINWILNNKPGYTIADVQTAIWLLMGTYGAPLSPTDPAMVLFNAASTATAKAYVPPPSGTMMVLLEAPNNPTTGYPDTQHMILEVTVCGQIGDRVWQDSTVNGLQDATLLTGFTPALPADFFGYSKIIASTPAAYRYTEPGIAGVTVRLLDANKNQVYDANGVAVTAVTALSPRSYPYLPWASNGFYQFKGLCDGTFYVAVDRSTLPLGLVPTTPLEAGGAANYGINSRDDTGAKSVLPTSLQTRIDETLDFGYTGSSAVQVTCLPSTATGRVGAFFDAFFTASGGVPSTTAPGYTFTTSGSVPGLTLNTTGELSGSPTTVGAYSLLVTATDGQGHQGSQTCPVNISAPPISVQCAPQTTAAVGSFYNSLVTASGGVPPYTFAISPTTPLPVNLTLTNVPPTSTTSNINSGRISGYPDQSVLQNGLSTVWNYVVQVTDTTGAGSLAQNNTCGITIRPRLAITCATVNIVAGNLMRPFQVVASGGSGTGYRFSSSTLPHGLTISTDGVISGTPDAVTAATTYNNIVITVVDSEGNSANLSCLVIVVNPKPTGNCASYSFVAGYQITQTAALSGSLGNGGAYTFSSTLPTGLTMASDGSITGTPDASLVAQDYVITVTVKDGDGYVGTYQCTITILPRPKPACLAAPLTLVQGFPMTPIKLSATGGAAGTSYIFEAQGLPDGLFLDQDGTLHGTPTTAQATAVTFSVRVTDNANHVGDWTPSCVGIIVNPAPAPICLAPISVVQGMAVKAGYKLTGQGGIGPNYTFAGKGLPSGMSILSDGTITGTPDLTAAPGTYQIQVQVTDSANHTSEWVNCGTIVVYPAITPVCSSGITLVQGATYTTPIQAIVVTGGSGSGYTITASGLPAGLTMDANGYITGTAPAASQTPYGFTVTITDKATGYQTTANCGNIVVNPPPTISCASIVTLAGAQLASPVVLTASGGIGPYTFSISGLPAGLTATPGPTTLTITGAALVAPGTYSPVITVTDSQGNSVQVKCLTITVPPVTVTCAAITNAIMGTPITPVTLVASGGSGTGYTFVATGLPTGLTMSPGGTISGTPLINGSFNYTVTVTDSRGNVGTANCTVVVLGGNMCGLTWGYWKNHNWPVYPTNNGITVGGQTYSPADIKAIFAMPVAGDASIDLAHQLFAAWLNVYNGTDIRTDTNNAISKADALLKLYPGRIPLGVPSTDPNGALMVQYASWLDYFNQDGQAQPGCVNGPTALSLKCATSTGVVGVAYSSAVVASGGMGAPYTYAITSGTLPAGLTLNADGTITGTPTTAGAFNFTVTAYDSSWVSGTTGAVSSNCSITISPAPTANCVSITATQGVAITAVTMTATGGTGGPYTFSATGLPAGLTMSATGTISGTPTVYGAFPYTVTITDASGNVGTVNCSVTVAPPPSNVTGNCVTINAIQGAPIANVTMNGSGGTGPYTFTATGLPNGLTMSSTGTISGTPLVTGTFSYTVTIVDKNGKVGIVNCSVTVNPPISVTCVNLSAIYGVAIAPVTLTASGGIPGYTFTATGLPAGIKLSSTGVLSGTPTASGTFLYTVTVTDSKKNVATATCSITVGVSSNMCGLTWGYWKNHVSAWPVTSMVLGNQSYSQTELQNILNLPVAGDASLDLAHQLIAAKFNVLHGTNPATDGGAIAAADNILDNYSGKLPYNVPSASTAGATMTSIASQLDYFNQDGKAQPGCGSGPTALIVTCAASTGTVGVAYSSAIVASGGMGAPYTYTLVSGALPPGLTLNADGTLTGTPTDDGVYAFSILVADSSNNTGTAIGTTTTNCTITIVPRLICPTATATVNTNYAAPIVVTGGTGPYTFSITSGSLPPGLTLDTANGAIKGAPTASGTYSFTISAYDTATGLTTTSNCAITVAGPAIVLLCPAGTAQTTVNYSSQAVVTGGTPGYLFSLTSGSLPPGLTPNASTGYLTGVPTATGTYSFGIKVTDSLGATGSASCSIVVTTPTGTISAGMFTTYTQGGWGASPKGNNPGMFLSKNFSNLYGSTGVTIGGNYKLTFQAATNIDAFLPQGGTASILKASALNPTGSAAGVLAGQVLALQLSVDCSNKGLTPGGLSSLHVVSGKMINYTVGQVLTIANQVLGGTTSALPAGMSVSDLNSVLDSINQNFDNGTSNKGYLKY